jgi:hypothetical protein
MDKNRELMMEVVKMFKVRKIDPIDAMEIICACMTCIGASLQLSIKEFKEFLSACDHDYKLLLKSLEKRKKK